MPSHPERVRRNYTKQPDTPPQHLVVCQHVFRYHPVKDARVCVMCGYVEDRVEAVHRG